MQIELRGPEEPSEDDEINQMTLSSRHRIPASNPDCLRSNQRDIHVLTYRYLWNGIFTLHQLQLLKVHTHQFDLLLKPPDPGQPEDIDPMLAYHMS